MRAVLGFLVISALQKFRSKVHSRFGLPVAKWHLAITLSQFHLLFYISRPLPNIFALCMTLHALSYWLECKPAKFIISAAGAILIFRGELGMRKRHSMVMQHTCSTAVKEIFSLPPKLRCCNSYFL